MVAKITTPKSIEAALDYNEKKVRHKMAHCLHAANYLNDAKDMNFYQKLNGFERLNSLNDRATTKTLHISLNFDPSEKLPENKLVEIANVYMEKIGFGQQPFLIYKHEDAGHPHIHIVSTTIKEDGRRINTHNIGRNQSEKARKEIENTYGLIKAEGQQKIINQGVKPVAALKVIYGTAETKRSISNVVTTVFNQYKFISLPEFNAALKQFNVVADRGKEGGRIYKNHGLVYRILDTSGNKVGVPIKGSSFSCKPILANLEKKFLSNELARESLQQRTRNAIDECLQTSPGSMNLFVEKLSKQEIYTVLRQNSEGRLYGITFVDNQNKVVFNGSDLGKGYSAAALQSKLANTSEKSFPGNEQKSSSPSVAKEKEIDLHKQQDKTIEIDLKASGLLDILLSKGQYDAGPNNLLQKRKKKRKKNVIFK